VVGYLDLVLLALALPVFLLAGWPLGGYAVAAGAWLAQRGIQIAASRRATGAQKRGERRAALGILAGATLARVWLIALAVLLVGLAEREAGLAAAVLSAALFTLYLATQFATRMLGPQEPS
jgi:putative exporter of polyketide antibiotics